MRSVHCAAASAEATQAAGLARQPLRQRALPAGRCTTTRQQPPLRGPCPHSHACARTRAPANPSQERVAGETRGHNQPTSPPCSHCGPCLRSPWPTRGVRPPLLWALPGAHSSLPPPLFPAGPADPAGPRAHPPYVGGAQPQPPGRSRARPADRHPGGAGGEGGGSGGGLGAVWGWRWTFLASRVPRSQRGAERIPPSAPAPGRAQSSRRNPVERLLGGAGRLPSTSRRGDGVGAGLPRLACENEAASHFPPPSPLPRQVAGADLDDPVSLSAALEGAAAVYCHALSKWVTIGRLCNVSCQCRWQRQWVRAVPAGAVQRRAPRHAYCARGPVAPPCRDGVMADPQELVRARNLADAAAAAGASVARACTRT